jgi:hypothetical protein
MGLASRVAPSEWACAEAESLAAAMTALPQACRAGDRSSAYEPFDGALTAVLESEFIHGIKALAFASGTAGRRHFSPQGMRANQAAIAQQPCRA